jgi:hypothetical protein
VIGVIHFDGTYEEPELAVSASVSGDLLVCFDRARAVTASFPADTVLSYGRVEIMRELFMRMKTEVKDERPRKVHRKTRANSPSNVELKLGGS